MKKFRDGMFGPTVILGVICLIITFALAGTYEATKDTIKEVELAQANAARGKVLASGVADGFTLIEGIEMPEGVLEAYKANNGSGYVFKAGAKGFGGMVTFFVGVDSEGNYVGINMFDHKETPGLGTKVAAVSYLEKYYKAHDPNGVDAITGATRTSNALKNTLRACNDAFELAKEGV